MSYTLDMPYAHGGPLGTALFRAELADFIVIEDLGAQPEGEGEHHYLHLEKRGVNTDWVAQRIARIAGVKAQDVGFCGLKDRYAIASQWFSVYLPKGGVADWSVIEDDEVKLLTATVGKRKLRRGQHAGNRFIITLREIADIDADKLRERLELIASVGVPNYFGEQRFGRDGNNLVSAARWLEQGAPLNKMRDKGMVMSAARSYLFNLVLAERVRQGNWSAVLAGDVSPEFATGPLWGRGRNLATLETLALEELALAERQQWLAGLEHCGLQQERRKLVLAPQALQWEFTDGVLRLEFGLAPGEFATALLREIFLLRNAIP
jgi:tRNA pseudouridine13 synthase